MAITYTRARADWQDDAAGGTPILAANLDTIEAGLDGLYKLVNAKGDLIVATAADTLERLSVGAANTLPVATPAANEGIVWQQITDAQIAASAGIGFGKLSQAAWSTYTPAFTTDGAGADPNLGSGFTLEGRYVRVGKLVVASVLIIFGSSGVDAGVGTYVIGLPVAARTAQNVSIGGGHITDAGVDNYIVDTQIATTSSNMWLIVEAGNIVSNASPFAWGASDRISLSVFYESA